MDDVKKLQKLIDESENIVFFGGAGVSTESGIKDFRGKNGLYKENKYNRPPEYMLSINCLLDEPDLFFKYYKENLNSLDIKPNVTHNYLAKLEEKGKLKAVVTQNIDGLHQRAGSKNVLEVHGTTYKNYCMKCNKSYPFDYIFNSDGIPKCECGGIIRPSVTLYGEMLPDDFIEAERVIKDSDLLIVAGSSLTVQPASSLVTLARNKLVIINRSETPYDRYADLVIHKPLKDVFEYLK